MAQLAWLEGRADDAIAGWREALAHEEEIDVYGQAAETRVRLAHALAQRGDRAAAAQTLVPVFEQAMQEGGPGGALLATDALKELADIDWRGQLSDAQREQLRAWWGLLAVYRAPPVTLHATAVTGAAGASGLTPREIEVLSRIAAGDSNKLIARAFDLSLHTVKRHVAHILDKLDLDSRGQAAAWYRSQFAAGSVSATR